MVKVLPQVLHGISTLMVDWVGGGSVVVIVVGLGLVMKIVSLPAIFRVLCGVQICVGVDLRGSVEPAV